MPTIHLPPGKGAAFLRRLVPALLQSVVAAETKNLDAAETDLIRASSGTHTAAELRKAGHPYALRAPNKRFNPDIINKGKTGAFRSGWHKSPVTIQKVGGDYVITGRVVNTDPKARFMRGTTKMVPRKIVLRVENRAQTARIVRLRNAGSSAYQKAKP